MTAPVIDTPRGTIVVTKMGKASLTFKPDFQPKWQRRYSDSQKFCDSEVLRLSEPYTPLLTGMMIKSGILGTDIGSGLVQWIAPYTRKNYYSPRKPGSMTGPLRGPFWFERMKAVSGQTIITGARKIAGRGK
ncbi:MAG: hypothetical protein V1897_00210, partial [Pseudomonadota bacterium]